MNIDEVWELINTTKVLIPVRCGKTEFWAEVLRRACVIDPVGYKPFYVEIPQGKILTDLYKHEKWEIPYTDEWVKYTIIKDLQTGRVKEDE